MPLSRLVYVSENQIAPASLLTELKLILGAARRNNKALGLSGALVFDDMWFMQALEGERKIVVETFDRLKHDERHANVMLIEVVEVPHRTFGNWWMGIASRTQETQCFFSPYCRHGVFRADELRAQEIVKLMVALTQFGLHRELAHAAS